MRRRTEQAPLPKHMPSFKQSTSQIQPDAITASSYMILNHKLTDVVLKCGSKLSH